jgi:hypothetical protein
MNRYCEVIEYASDGVVLDQAEIQLIDPADTAAERLEDETGSRTGRRAYVDVTKGRGPLVWGRFDGRTGPWPVAFVWLRETDEPWRSAWGLAVRTRRSTFVAGIGRHSGPPSTEVLMKATEPLSWNVAPGALTGR